MKKALTRSLSLLIALTNFACSSTTLIQSSDPEAKIFVDGQMMGKGTVSWSDTKIIGSTTQVMLKKEGCENQTFMFSRNEEFDAGACAGGVFLLFPFLWIQKYRPQHNFEFECDVKAGSKSVHSTTTTTTTKKSINTEE